jgi:hypothetical protein
MTWHRIAAASGNRDSLTTSCEQKIGFLSVKLHTWPSESVSCASTRPGKGSSATQRTT